MPTIHADDEYLTPLECKYANGGAFPIIMDVLIFAKAIFLIVRSIQGLCWWKKTNTKHCTISILLWAGMIIVSLNQTAAG